MPKQVILTAPWPTFEEMTKDLDIPVERQRELDAMAQDIFEQMVRETQAAPAAASGREKKPRNASAAD